MSPRNPENANGTPSIRLALGYDSVVHAPPAEEPPGPDRHKAQERGVSSSPQLFDAHLRLRHEGCFSTKVGQGEAIVHLTGDSLDCLTFISAPSEAARHRLEDLASCYLGGRPRTANGDQTQSFFTCACGQHGVVPKITSTGCSVLWPLVHRAGFEYYHIVAPTRESLASAYHNLAPLGDVRIDRIEPFSHPDFVASFNLLDLEHRLSPRQVGAFRLAVSRGYYAIPRRTDARTLAKEMGVSRSTFQEHLRKAEVEVLGKQTAEIVAAAAISGKKPVGRPPSRKRSA